MRSRQPDFRIAPRDLGMLVMGGKRMVVNLKPGGPFNDLVEEFRNGSLRSWATHNFLNDSAARLVSKFATYDAEGNKFLWNDEVRRGRIACRKGDHTLFRVVLPKR